MRRTEEYTLNAVEDVQSEKVKKEKKKDFGLFEVFESLIAAVAVITLLFTFVVRIVSVDGPSMKPTLQDGDRLIVTAWGYKPERGDVVVMSGAEDLKEPIVKRIIAVGGDVVDINFTTGIVTVNGEEEEYTDNLTNQQFDIAFPITVEEGKVFVLGDNRAESLDSRSTVIGCIDERCIVGRVVGRFFPLGRWNVE